MAKTTPKSETKTDDSRSKSLKNRFSDNGRDTPQRRQFDFTIANPVHMVDAVSRCVGAGDAIMFSLTRDGGAGVIKILSGADRQSFYPANERELDHALRLIAWGYMSNADRIENEQVTAPLP